jgi:hypothetical protein
MGWLVASYSYLPFAVGSCVLGGFALWGWRRSGATGALLIAVAAGLQVLHALFGVYQIWSSFAHGLGGVGRMALLMAAMSAGSFVSQVLFIVGVALVLRRLPSRRASR